MASWGEMLKAYETEKRGPLRAVPAQSQVVAGQGIPRKADMRQDEQGRMRRYDVIKHRFVDQGAEKATRRREQQTRIDQINRAKDFSLKFESRWDVVSHSAKKGAPVQRRKIPRRRLMPDSYSGYDIVTNREANRFVASHRTPYGVKNEPEPPSDPTRGLRLQHAVERRGYDVLSGQYSERHEERSSHDRAREKKEAAKKWFTERHYDPVRSVYYDEDKEREFQARRRVHQMESHKERVKRLPQVVQRSEGQMYDITTLRVKNEALVAQTFARRQKAKGGRATHEVEGSLREKGFADAERERARAMARFKHRSQSAISYREDAEGRKPLVSMWREAQRRLAHVHVARKPTRTGRRWR